MNRINKLKQSIKDCKKAIKEYKETIKQLESETEIIKTTHVPEGDYTTAQLKDLVIISENK